MIAFDSIRARGKSLLYNLKSEILVCTKLTFYLHFNILLILNELLVKSGVFFRLHKTSF